MDGPRFVQLPFFDWLEVVALDLAIPDKMARNLGPLVQHQHLLTGTNVQIRPRAMAEKLHVSERTIERWINRLLVDGYLVQTACAAPSRAATFALYGPATSDIGTPGRGGRSSAIGERENVGRSGGSSSDIGAPEHVGRVGRTSATAERSGGGPKHHESTHSSSSGVARDAGDSRTDDDGRRQTNNDQVDAIAQQILEARAPSALPWDLAGVRPVVAKCIRDGRDFGQLLAAGRAAAADPSARTPATITWARYWQPEARRDSPDIGPHCRTCGKPEPQCRLAARKTNDPHPFEAKE